MRRYHAAATALAALALAGGAQGQAWNENGDAGNLPITAQYVVGSGPLTGISGVLSPDDVDMYVLEITEPTQFSVSTVGTAFMDTQLFLFKPDGTGIAMDDDAPGQGVLQSALSSAFTAGLAPGTYYLAVTTYDVDPVAGAAEIWADAPFDLERAPDGPNPGGSVDGWIDSGDEGTYTITLSGTAFTAAPIVGACTLPSGACVTTTQTLCQANGGTYQGNGSECPKGACCKLDGTCSLLTAQDCAAANGIYGGDNSTCGTTCPRQFVYSGGSVAIPDGQPGPTCGSGPGAEAIAEIVVNESFPVSSVSASYYIEHSWQGDLVISLRHVTTGTTVVLVDRAGSNGPECGFATDNFGSVNPTFFRSIDSAAATYDVGSPGAPANNASGPWKSENPLTAFIGESAAGPWQLIATDWSEQDTGFINAFILELGGPSCYPDCNGDGALNLSDFGCFTTKFALGDPYADCNGDGQLNLSDFGCFTTKFALGCN
ncbi:MAG: DVUA0089 family protein [Phycisphaerales bacterium]|nr:DVUA0089 family protein [Phycisphaerales bacterium]